MIHSLVTVSTSSPSVMSSLRTTPDLGGGLPNQSFVPDFVGLVVLQWGHSSTLSYYPGFTQTLYFLRQCFSITQDARALISTSPVCPGEVLPPASHFNRSSTRSFHRLSSSLDVLILQGLLLHSPCKALLSIRDLDLLV